MPELRWTLLIIGVLFIAILAWWERRRPHQASRQAPHIGGEPRPVVSNDPSWGPDIDSGNSRANPNALREPLILPEIRTEVREARGRESTVRRELPVVEIPASSPIGLRADNEEDDEEAIAAEEAEEAEEAIAEDDEGEESAVPVVESMSAGQRPQFRESAPEPGPVQAKASVHAPEPEPAPEPAPEPTTGSAHELPPPIVATVRPIVEWPPEDQRKLVSLRLVARPPERFRGSLVRQALAAEGFVLGDLDIFHKPDAQNRAVLSAASLTKPGTFDLDTMDTQRYVGLNLFAVLPGPKTPQKAFEDLLQTARMLNERLEGALQDERGGPLTPTRVQALRDALGVEAKS
ncbi:MAG: cell division protein ZipA C-terminal FtsZ-binding domain-containing protein [Steroidobacteraceae bacterium]